uniref:Transposase Tc1-like domain-containing protein n=1 Tax=Hippocampus comes TaxID=109280 RepID=A0A3Q2Y453_HIPCM
MRTACRILRKAILADTGVLVHYSTCKRCLHKHGLHPLFQPQHNNHILKFATDHMDKPVLSQKSSVLWTPNSVQYLCNTQGRGQPLS